MKNLELSGFVELEALLECILSYQTCGLVAQCCMRPEYLVWTENDQYNPSKLFQKSFRHFCCVCVCVERKKGRARGGGGGGGGKVRAVIIFFIKKSYIRELILSANIWNAKYSFFPLTPDDTASVFSSSYTSRYHSPWCHIYYT